MFHRSALGGLLLAAVLPLTSCVSSPSLTSIVVSPSVINFGGAGLKTQLTAIGYYTHPGHPPETHDITGLVTWKSSSTDCVIVSTSTPGLIISGGNVCSGILVMASSPGFNGLITGTMTVNVTQPGAAGSSDVAVLVVSPANPAPLLQGGIEQFSATGFTAAGAQATLTNPVAWTSSNSGVASIDQTGRATALAAGTTTITAAYTNADGTQAVNGTATLTVQ